MCVYGFYYYCLLEPNHIYGPIMCIVCRAYETKQVHVLPREMFGASTFGIAMKLLRWLPIKMVDRMLLLVARMVLGDTEKHGLRRPKLGPLEIKNVTGKSPVLDVGAWSFIKSGNIKVRAVVKGHTEIKKSDVVRAWEWRSVPGVHPSMHLSFIPSCCFLSHVMPTLAFTFEVHTTFFSLSLCCWW
jgi:hypothetical protein